MATTEWNDADELSPTGYAQPRDVTEDSGPPTKRSEREPTTSKRDVSVGQAGEDIKAGDVVRLDQDGKVRKVTCVLDKKDYGKDRYDLLDEQAEAEMVRVMTWGATKYEDFGWKTIPHAKERYTAALRRHLAAWRMGEKLDPESGLPHLAHMACCAHFLQALDRINP